MSAERLVMNRNAVRIQNWPSWLFKWFPLNCNTPNQGMHPSMPLFTESQDRGDKPRRPSPSLEFSVDWIKELLHIKYVFYYWVIVLNGRYTTIECKCKKKGEDVKRIAQKTVGWRKPEKHRLSEARFASWSKMKTMGSVRRGRTERREGILRMWFKETCGTDTAWWLVGQREKGELTQLWLKWITLSIAARCLTFSLCCVYLIQRDTNVSIPWVGYTVSKKAAILLDIFLCF